MSIQSPYPPFTFEAINLLDYAFPASEALSDEPLWIDSQDPEKALSPKQALQWTKRTAFGLEKKLGLQRGDVVMIYTANHIFMPPAFYGIVGGGFVFSAANPAYTVNGKLRFPLGDHVRMEIVQGHTDVFNTELVHQMRNLEPKVLLVQPPFLQTALEAASQVGIRRDHIFQFSDEPFASSTQNGEVADWRSMLGTPAQGDGYRWPSLSSEESRTTVAAINFSSGTTGFPKGVCVTHANLIANVEQSLFLRYAETTTPYVYQQQQQQPPQQRQQEFSPPQERYVGMLPLYHAFGQHWILLIPLRLRHPVYLMKAFQYEAFLQTVTRYKITMLQVPPPVLTMLCKRPETMDYDLSSVRLVFSGAAPLSRELQNEVQTRFHMQIVQGWGMTELTCAGAMMPGGSTDSSGSVGVLVPLTEGRLVDDEGQLVTRRQGEKGRGQRGELLVKGPQVCLGYWRNEGATRETLSEDGWLRTGDVVEVDERGWVWIVDRKKELIKVNAFQVAPAELEKILLENEHVYDAAVVGITM